MPPAAILVVEDNPITRKMIRVTLESDGYRVLEAGDGRTAMELAAQHTLALILQDLHLPDIDGLDLHDRLRSTASASPVPIIAFSGLQSRMEEARSMNAGFADYLFKPIAPSRLLETIRTHLPAATGKSELGARRRVLLVDDDPAQCRLDAARLKEVGFEVIMASDGEEALKLATERPPDAVVTHILLAGVNGLDLCVRLRSNDRLTHVPVVLTSATCQYLERGDLGLVQELGASALVPRSTGLEEVIGALLESLKTGAPPRPAPEVQAISARFFDRLLRQMKLQAALNTRLTHRAALDAALLSITASAGAVLTSRVGLQAMLDQVLAYALDAGGVSAGSIYLIESDGTIRLRAEVSHLPRPADADAFFGHPELLRSLVTQGRPIHLREGELPPGSADLLRRAGARSMVVAPLVTSGESLGALVMMVGSRQVESSWLGSIGAIATQLAQAVALSRTVDEMTERARIAEVSADVSRALAGSATREEMLQSCARSLAQLGGGLAGIWTLDPALSVLELAAADGPVARPGTVLDAVPVGETEIGLVARQRGPVLIDPLPGDPRAHDPDWVRAEALVAFAGYPLIAEGALIGVLGLFTRKPVPNFMRESLASVADGIAVGLERRRAEADLRSVQSRLQYVVGGSPAVTYAHGPEAEGFIATWISENVERVLGYTVPEALAPGWWIERVHPDDVEQVLADLPSLARRGRLVHEYRFRNKDGAYRWILDEQRVPDEPGRRGEVIGSWVDITERRELEDQFRQAQKMEAVGQLAGGVAHDFNNLLTAIIGYAELGLQDVKPEDPLREDLEEIRKASHRASGLTSQLLAFSRQQVLAPRVLDLNAVVAEIERMIRRMVSENVEIATLLSPELGRVRADPGQVHQVLMNLIVNARDAMPDGGKLTIETFNYDVDDGQLSRPTKVPAGQYVVLAVSDSGIGMDERTRARIFEPFFTTKEQGKGTGLGLSTVYGIVKQSNGYVWVYSEPGQGTTFRVYLPRVAAAAEETGDQAPADVVGGSETVLLVEDDDGVRHMTRTSLIRRGYRVLEATNGGEAIRLSDSYSGVISLLLTDVVMPGIGGRDLVRRLAPLRPEMKVLFVSGYTDLAVVHHGEIEPGTAFLSKPYTPDTLARKVREVLDARPDESVTGGSP